jgi:hypothetical protein
VRSLGGLGSLLGMEHDLHGSGGVPEVDEDHAFVVAQVMNPSRERDR